MKEDLSSIGVLEPPEGLLQALTSRRGKEEGTHITDLPVVVLGSILARIEDPIDIVAVLCACRLFWALSLTAPFRLRLRPRQSEESLIVGGSCEDSGRFSTQAVGLWTRAALSGIRRHMRATRELDLAGCPIMDDDVTAVLADLRCLERLILDGCQKLTSAVADALAVSVRSGPRALSLQRCYRLGPAAAGNLLAAAAADDSRLHCILLSHLDRLDLPREPPLLDIPINQIEKEGASVVEFAKSIVSVSSGAGLRVLALHNCGSLGSFELAAVACTCPLLELLLLGGSVEGLGLCRPEALPQEKVAAAVSALVRTTEALPRIRVLEITFFTAAVTQAVREQDQKGIQVWDFCDEGSVAAASAMLENFKVIESGKTCSQYISRQSTSGSRGHYSLPVHFSRTVRAQFWQDGLNLSDCIDGGSMSYQREFGVAKAETGFYPSHTEDKWESLEEDVLLALHAAANCSDSRRRTPLHVAAARGDVPMVAGLLAIGAAAKGTKDSAGATALFVAAECGHAHICELLLREGAEVLASNRAGETPLYIAALRGHSASVGVMLTHCHERGLNWQDADIYGDGWTPLMAAAVADRQDVGKVLLWAAGADLGMGPSHTNEPVGDKRTDTFQEESDKLNGSHLSMRRNDTGKEGLEGTTCAPTHLKSNSRKISSKSGREGKLALAMRPPPQLLDAQNRYGQTALHIAARRASVWFVVNLLRSGASLEVRDAYGMCAVDVAIRQNHTVIIDILKQWESFQQKRVDGPSAAAARLSPAALDKPAPDMVKRSSKSKVVWVPKSASPESANALTDQPRFPPSSDIIQDPSCISPGFCTTVREDSECCLKGTLAGIEGLWSKISSGHAVSAGHGLGISDRNSVVENNILGLIQEARLKGDSREAHGGNKHYWRGRGTRRRVFPDSRVISSNP